MTDLAIQGNGFFVLKKGEQHLLHPRRRLRPRPGRHARQSRQRLSASRAGWPRPSTARRSSTTSGATPGPRHPRRAPRIRPRRPSRVDLACNLDKRTAEIPDGRRRGRPSSRAPGGSRRRSTTPSARRTPCASSSRKVAGQPNQWQATVTVDPEAPAADQRRRRPRTAPAPARATPSSSSSTTAASCAASRDGQGNASPRPAPSTSACPSTWPARLPAPDGGATRQTFRLNLGTVGLGDEHRHPVGRALARPRSSRQDGYTMGYLDTFKIDQSGVITARLLERLQPDHRPDGPRQPSPTPAASRRWARPTSCSPTTRAMANIGPVRHRRQGQDHRGHPRDVQRRPRRAVHRHDRHPARLPGQLEDHPDLATRCSRSS